VSQARAELAVLDREIAEWEEKIRKTNREMHTAEEQIRVLMDMDLVVHKFGLRATEEESVSENIKDELRTTLENLTHKVALHRSVSQSAVRRQTTVIDAAQQQEDLEIGELEEEQEELSDKLGGLKTQIQDLESQAQKRRDTARVWMERLASVTQEDAPRVKAKLQFEVSRLEVQLQEVQERTDKAHSLMETMDKSVKFMEKQKNTFEGAVKKAKRDAKDDLLHGMQSGAPSMEQLEDLVEGEDKVLFDEIKQLKTKFAESMEMLSKLSEQVKDEEARRQLDMVDKHIENAEAHEQERLRKEAEDELARQRQEADARLEARMYRVGEGQRTIQHFITLLASAKRDNDHMVQQFVELEDSVRMMKKDAATPVNLEVLLAEQGFSMDEWLKTPMNKFLWLQMQYDVQVAARVRQQWLHQQLCGAGGKQSGL